MILDATQLQTTEALQRAAAGLHDEDGDPIASNPAEDASIALRTFPPTLDAAAGRLRSFDVRGYARTRNHLEGNVSRLNPYVTWGVWTLRELLDEVAGRHGRHDKDLDKFTSEVGWKAYFREAFRALGGRVYRPLEPYKYPRNDGKEGAPEGIAEASTGSPCIDTLINTLTSSGYLHNHGRLWLAAWWTHYARHDPMVGEAFTYRHLLDGEPGPNALSWQWVASTFANKPYAFTADNMRRFGLEGCTGAPFDVSYEALDRSYFGGYLQGGFERRPHEQPHTVPAPPLPKLLRPATRKPVVVLHAERLSPTAAALAEYPAAPVAVVLDLRRLAGESPSMKRLAFALGLASDLVRTLRTAGRDAHLLLLEAESELVALARDLGCDGFVAPDSWHPGTWRTLGRLDEHLPVAVTEDAPLATVRTSLRSFSAFWKRAEREVRGRMFR